MKILASIVAAWIAAAQLLPAQTPAETAAGPSQDSIVLTTAFDDYRPGGLGSNGTFDWVHHSKDGTVYNLGTSVFSAPSGRWSFARIGTLHPFSGKMSVQANASVGGGAATDGGFGYQIYEGSFLYRLSTKLGLRAGDEFFSIAATRGHLLKQGLTIVPVKAFQVETTYARSVSGNLGTAYLFGQMDLMVRSVGISGGYSFGNIATQSLNLEPTSSAAAQSFHETFAGVGFHFSTIDVRVISDFLTAAQSKRRSLALAWTIPLQKSKRRGHD